MGGLGDCSLFFGNDILILFIFRGDISLIQPHPLPLPSLNLPFDMFVAFVHFLHDRHHAVYCPLFFQMPFGCAIPPGMLDFAFRMCEILRNIAPRAIIVFVLKYIADEG